MRRLLATSVATTTIVLTQLASAADLPRKAPVAPPPLPVYSWTGFYIGGHVGYGWRNVDTSYTPLPDPVAFGALAPTVLGTDVNGVFGGGQIGYNWQASPHWVIGVEADISWSGIKGSSTLAPVPPFVGVPLAGSYLSTSTDINWFGTVRGRLGFLVTPTLLLYGSGGFAYGDVDHSANTFYPGAPGAQYPANVSKTKTGWTAGGGLEWAFANNWSAKIEYLYIDLGDESVVANVLPVNPFGDHVAYSWDTKINTVRLGLNYKFSGPY